MDELFDKADSARGRRLLEVVGVAAVLGAAAYMFRGALDGFFVQDDFGWLEESRFPSLADYLGCFFRFSPVLGYRPLSQETFFLVCQKLFGLRPFGFHVLSLAFHLLGSFVLYLLLRRFFPAASSLAATLFYAVHSAHHRSTYWIAAVPEPMALLFYLTAALLFVQYDREQKRWLLACSFGAMALGVMSKESILSLPLVLGAYCLIFSRRRLASTIPFFAMSGGYFVARAVSRAVRAAPYPLTFGREAWQNFLSYVAWASGFTEGLLRLKLKWDADACYPFIAGAAGALILLLVITARERRLALFGLAWFVIALQPVLYFSRHIYPYYLAPALAGLALFLASMLNDIGRRSRAVSTLLGVGLVSFSLWASLATVKREGRWWNQRSREAERILKGMPEVDRQVAPGQIAYLMGFGEYEFGAMQNDAAIKAFGYSPSRFILVGLDPETPEQIRVLTENRGIADYFCFVYSSGRFVNWTREFHRNPASFVLIQPPDRLESLARGLRPDSAVKLTPESEDVEAGRDTLALRLTNLDVPAIDVLYTLEGRLMPAVTGWRLDERRMLRVFVDSSTPRGWYHYRAIRDSRTAGLGGWIPVDAGILVH